MEKALIAMSGGVDSSVAALLTKNKGFECIGCTMKLFSNDLISLTLEESKCCSLNDIEDARSVANKLEIPYYVFNFSDDFKSKVVDKFVFSYENGMTPNPCIDCNKYLKFAKLFERSKELGCDYVVTGHYARVEFDGNKYILKKALDETKDQSYVLYSLTQEQLSHVLFPLGSLSKTETRKIALDNGFVNARKKDSQDICFVPDGDYVSFLKRYTKKEYAPGNYIDLEGNVLGNHKGIIKYTIGQHKGLGISTEEPLYVGEVDIKNNTVTLVKNADLYKKDLLVKNFNWISGEKPSGQISCLAKVRYRQKEQEAVATPLGKGMVKIEFKDPQRAITPGQSAVLYDGDVVIGGGEIY